MSEVMVRKASGATQQVFSAELAAHQEKIEITTWKIKELSQEQSDLQLDLESYYQRLNQAQSTFFAIPQGTAFDVLNDIVNEKVYT